MASCKHHKPENNLAKIYRGADGITLSEAILRADVAIERRRPHLVQAIHDKLSILQSAADSVGGPQQASEIQRVYRLANEIFAEAGALGLDRLSWAARSFCDLIVVFKAEARWDREAVEVYVATMRLMHSLPPSTDDRQWEAIQSGLKRIADGGRAAFGGPARPHSSS